MSKQNERVEFKKLDAYIIECCYFDCPETISYLSWKIPINEVNDLAKWWNKEGKQVKKKQLPIVGHKYRSICITMFTHAGVDMRGFEQHGGLKLLGYSLPIKVLERLVIWLQDDRISQKSNNKKKA